MKTKLILILCLLVPGFASADDAMKAKVELNLPSYQTLKKFSKEQLELYVLGLRSTIEEIETMQNQEGVEYANAPAWNFGFLSEAEAATRGPRQCIYGGWVRTRNANGKCPRPDKGGCTGPNFRCPIIYGGKCVGFQHYATRACVRSSRTADHVSAVLLSDASGESQRAWDTYTTEIQAYCGQGSYRRFCQTLQRRVREIRDISGVAEFVAPPGSETVPAPPGAVTPPGTVTLRNPNETGDANACFSELLVQTTRCNNGPLKMAMTPDIAYRAFCQADVALLESNIAAIRAQSDSQISCLRSQAARGGGDRYTRRAVQDQVRLAADIRRQIDRCYQFVKSGNKIPSKRLGTLRFPADTSQPVEVTTSGNPAQTVTLQAGFFAASINLQRTSGRFCDYDLAGVAASAPTFVRPPTPPSPEPQVSPPADAPVSSSVPLPSSLLPVSQVGAPAASVPPPQSGPGRVRTADDGAQ